MKEKNKSIVKICKFGESIKMICRRGFKNVQELQIYHNNDYSMFMIKAIQYQDKTEGSYYGKEKMFHYNQSINKFEEVVTFSGMIQSLKLSDN